jgi:hypothetical protein
VEAERQMVDEGCVPVMMVEDVLDPRGSEEKEGVEFILMFAGLRRFEVREWVEKQAILK